MADEAGAPQPSSGEAAMRTRQQISSRMMKTTRRGRPFTKDTHDLFATLIVSLELTTHRALFKTYPNSFTTDEAAENLAALKFSQSNRIPDPNEPNRVITTTTTTTFTMNREMAKGICQNFMDARLIENAQDTAATAFKDKGIYMLTPKGLHILERFITKNGINGEHLLKVFSTQPICMKLLHLERRTHDDELLINAAIIEVIFRRFVGRQPNYPSRAAMYGGTPHMNQSTDAIGGGASVDGSGGGLSAVAGNGGAAGADDEMDFDRTLGVEMMDVAERGRTGQLRVIKHTFAAVTVLDWLVDYTTLAGRDEASEVAAHFERLQLIELIADKPRSNKEANKPDPFTVVVRGEEVGGVITEGQFRCHPKAIYGMTDRGREAARWEGYRSIHSPHIGAPRESTDHAGSDTRSNFDDEARSVRSDQMRHGLPGSASGSTPSLPSTLPFGATSESDLHAVPDREVLVDSAASSTYAGAKDSNTNRLRQILEEPALRSLFREFLKRNFCEENLSFWLDVQDFKRRFHTTSSAVAVQPTKTSKDGMASKVASKLRGASGSDAAASAADPVTGYSAMERHQQDLIAMAFVIYNTYLAPSSPCELNIEHNLRTELVTYVNKIITEARGPAADLPGVHHSDLGLPLTNSPQSKAVPDLPLEDRRAASSAAMPKIPIHASQLQTMVRLYQRIQDHIFRLMATDSVPRFIKDPRFLSLVHSVEEYTKALESGRVDPRFQTGPAVGQDVLDAMDLGNLREALPR